MRRNNVHNLKVKVFLELFHQQAGRCDSRMTNDYHMKRNFLVFLALNGGADMNGDIVDFHFRNFPFHIPRNHGQPAMNGVHNIRAFLQNFLNHGLFRVVGGRRGKYGTDMVGEVFKKFVVAVQIDFQLFRNRGDKLARNHLNFHGVTLKGTLSNVTRLFQQNAQRRNVVFRRSDAAVLRDVAQNVLRHQVAFAVVEIGLRFQKFPLQIPVYHNAEVQQNVLKRIVRQEGFVGMLLLAEDFLQHHPVPGLYACQAADSVAFLRQIAPERPH